MFVGSNVTAASIYPKAWFDQLLGILLEYKQQPHNEVTPVTTGPVLFKSGPCLVRGA